MTEKIATKAKFSIVEATFAKMNCYIGTYQWQRHGGGGCLVESS